MGENTSFNFDELRALREALIEGERSGPSTPFDFDDFLARKRGAEPKRP